MVYVTNNVMYNNNKNYNIITFLYVDIVYFFCNYLVKRYLLKRINFRLTSLLSLILLFIKYEILLFKSEILCTVKT